MNKRDQMKHSTIKHGKQLLAIFPDATERDPDKLARKLRRIEVRLSRLSVDCCNGDSAFVAFCTARLTVYAKLNAILKPGPVPLYVNGDPRGYALKIDDEHVRKHQLSIHTDLGGYGILAPDFS